MMMAGLVFRLLFSFITISAKKDLMEEPSGIFCAKSPGEKVCGYTALIYEPVCVVLVLFPFFHQLAAFQDRAVSV